MLKQDSILLDSRIVCPNCNANAVSIIVDSESGELVWIAKLARGNLPILFY